MKKAHMGRASLINGLAAINTRPSSGRLAVSFLWQCFASELAVPLISHAPHPQQQRSFGDYGV